MVFLELRRDSRVTTGNSGCLLCWPRQVQSSIRVAKESWGLLSSDCRANRPHLGLCPEANVPLQVGQESRCCFPDSPGESGLISSGSKELRSPLESRRLFFGAPELPKGSQASCGVCGEHSVWLFKPCRKRQPSSRDDGVVSWFFSSCGASVGFLTRYDSELREPLVWRQGSHVSHARGEEERVIALESR